MTLSANELDVIARAILPIIERIRTQAVEAERARVCEWLRGQVAKGEAACIAATPGSRRQRDFASGVVVCTNAADAIARGDHLDGGMGE